DTEGSAAFNVSARVEPKWTIQFGKTAYDAARNDSLFGQRSALVGWSIQGALDRVARRRFSHRFQSGARLGMPGRHGPGEVVRAGNGRRQSGVTALDRNPLPD